MGVPIVAQGIKNPTNIYEDVGSIPGLTHWVKDPALPQASAQFADVTWIQGCLGRGVDLGCSSDPLARELP